MIVSKSMLKKNFVIASAIALVIMSCKKEPLVDDTALPSTKTDTTYGGAGSNLASWDANSPNTLAGWYQNKVNEASQTTTVSADSWSTVNGNQGTRIYFPSSSFTDADGNIVTGDVEVTLVEILKKSDMVLLNKTTTSNGVLLESGGELKIEAFQNGQKLGFNSAVSISINMPTYNPTEPFTSNFIGTLTSTGDVNWIVDQGSEWVLDSSNTFTMNFNGDSIGWINCDYFGAVGNNNVISVNVNEGFDASNTAVYFYFHDIYSVAPAVPNEDCECFKSYDSGLPVGQLVTFIAISSKDGKVYTAFSAPTALTLNHVETLTLVETTEAAYEAAVNAL
jgi:hypothetical protein